MSETSREIQFWKRLEGTTIKVFLRNHFKYEGKITDVCEGFLEIHDFKLNGKKIIRIENIEDVEVEE